MSPPQTGDYHPVDAIKAATDGALFTGIMGLVFAAAQNTLTRENRGALGVFTRGGGTILTFTIAGGIFEFAKACSTNLRQSNDAYNAAIGGFLGGAIIGMRTAKMPPVLGYGAATSIVLATAEYTGGLAGFRQSREVDEFERKEQLRLNRRRPIEETLAEIGEGRGIKPPGYEERRRQRLKDKYGFEVNTVSADANA